MVFLLFVAGLVLLIIGADAIVRGTSHLASAFGISPLVIGLTVVAFGTSSPEFAVSIKAAVSNQASIAVGNIIGSNIFNVLFILGLSALVIPLTVSQQLVRFDVPLMILLSVLVLILGWDNKFSRTDGLLLFTGLIIYIWYLIYQSRKESTEVKEEYAREFGIESHIAAKNPVRNIVLVIGGFALLIYGSRWLVDSAVSIAQDLGLSELIIGLTIIAAGTSLPEFVTSVIASIKGERDIAVGNVVGSNIFNIMGVLGLSSLIAPAGIDVSGEVIRFDIPIMIAVAFACLPIFFTDGMISRWEGGLLFGYYLAYTMYLILASAHHSALVIYSAAMLYFVIPLTTITLMILALRALGIRNKV